MPPHLSWKSAGRACFLLWCLVHVTRHTAWSLDNRMPHSCRLPPQSSLLSTSSLGCEATGTASVLTAWYLLSAPLTIPSDNACEVGQEVIFQKLPKKSKEMVLLSLDIRNCGYYWPLISDYYLFCMDHQNTLKYLAFPETICCQNFSFEECFPYVIKPHPISHLLKLSNWGKGQGKR